MNNSRTVDIDSYIINLNYLPSINKISKSNKPIKIKILNNKINKPILNPQHIILSNDEFDFIYNNNYNENLEDPKNPN
jgi:hypothetical protein